MPSTKEVCHDSCSLCALPRLGSERARVSHPRALAPATQTLRVILDGIFHVLRSSCQWRLLPREYGPWSNGLRVLSRVAAPHGYDAR